MNNHGTYDYQIRQSSVQTTPLILGMASFVTREDILMRLPAGRKECNPGHTGKRAASHV